MSKAAIEMKDISFYYGSKPILEGFNLSIGGGKTYCLVGSSGSGKTTTLRLINGLLVPKRGHILINGERFRSDQGEKWRRSMGYSIQGSGLFPHMSLRENLSIIARKEGWDKSKIDARIGELCDLMNLPSDKLFLQKKPREISGGQQQRVGIARALFMRPSIMLMDEPFSALDPITRMELQAEFIELQRQLQITIVLVTHDLPEAFSMGHEIVLLNKGAIEQQGRPREFLTDPNSEFVSSFISSHSPGNVLKGVYLYSVMNSKVHSCFDRENGIDVTSLSDGSVTRIADRTRLKEFLLQKGQKEIYWVNQQGHFMAAESFSGESRQDVLGSTEPILSGIKMIMQQGGRSLPLINREKTFVGVLDKEALDAL